MLVATTSGGRERLAAAAFGGALVLAIATAVNNANTGNTPEALMDGFQAAIAVSVIVAVAVGVTPAVSVGVGVGVGPVLPP